MSAFYPNSSAQLDVLSTPYVQDQKFTSYSDSPIIHHGNMMMYLHGAPSDISFSEINPGASMSTNNLSLSLSSHLSTAIPPPASYEQFSNQGISHVSKVDDAFQNSIRFEASNNQQDRMCNVRQYQQAGGAGVVMKSRFLKAAQQLLDEVVNVQDALKKQESGKDQRMKKVEDVATDSNDKSMAASGVNESASVQCKEFSGTERQDLQNKLDKLLAMLDEVDRRYKQYHHQMQVLVSSFDIISGCGAAKPYTTLALKTISRHFRSLRDGLSAEIQATRKNLGEQDCGQGVIPRLRYVDQQLRQQRALQQFGMMRHAWRPQRGLPENAVTTLRAWLFEHFLHPYPKDSEKIMLARQTGLTRGQVGNWFINARVRLWKPMIEDMYREEFGEAELNLKSSSENAPKAEEELQESFRSMAESDPHCHESKNKFNHHTTDMNNHGFDDKHKELMKLHANHHNIHNHGFYPHDQNGVMSFQNGVDSQVSLALGLQRIDGASTEYGVGPDTAEYSYFGQSRYLRPAQSLLEEITNLHGNSLELSDLRRMFFSSSRGATSSELKTELLILCSSSANKHELQTKISELIALLEQAENKYDEYCNRMQEAVSSFEVIAGEGLAKNYTALALEAMCRHFSSLREAILAQIKVAMKKLCSELPHMRKGLSNLSLFDRETRQKRSNIQQLGLIQQCQRQAWRPIRGLPENSVAILRAWLFEHFLHPYPNDPEKLMLASQTGLTKNQARKVRFWKPMIEEMYAEEFGESSSPGDSDPFFSSSCGSTREVQFDHAIFNYEINNNHKGCRQFIL
ncbi:hypothetical protein V2J09_011694 [Rumex salicifolius]